VNKGGDVLVDHGLSAEALARMLEKRRVQAGLRRLTWRDFRRTFAGNVLDNGNDLVTVQKLMGHASPTTTAAYDRRGEEVKRRASRSLHVPYLCPRREG
jgi:site-specific recombinase XerD